VARRIKPYSFGELRDAMLVEVRETVLVYQQAQLDAWKRGDKSLIPAFVDVPPIVTNQPRYLFGEMFALRHYYESGAWTGFKWYALGPQYPGSDRLKAGRAKVVEIIPANRLKRLGELRATSSVRRFGGGEPDLFLYKDVGRYKFVEVKKSTDRLRTPQLRCIAQIMRTLECDVDVVYLREAKHRYTPKLYEFDLQRCEGWLKSPNNALHRPAARAARSGR
jgi:hypothetical protein